MRKEVKKSLTVRRDRKRKKVTVKIERNGKRRTGNEKQLEVRKESCERRSGRRGGGRGRRPGEDT